MAVPHGRDRETIDAIVVAVTMAGVIGVLGAEVAIVTDGMALAVIGEMVGDAARIDMSKCAAGFITHKNVKIITTVTGRIITAQPKEISVITELVPIFIRVMNA